MSNESSRGVACCPSVSINQCPNVRSCGTFQAAGEGDLSAERDISGSGLWNRNRTAVFCVSAGPRRGAFHAGLQHAVPRGGFQAAAIWSPCHHRAQNTVEQVRAAGPLLQLSHVHKPDFPYLGGSLGNLHLLVSSSTLSSPPRTCARTLSF